MSAVQLHHRGRLVTAAVAGVLTVAAVALAVVAATAQQHAASPSPSAADPARERNLGSSMLSRLTSSSITARRTANETRVVGLILRRSLPVLLDVPRIGIHHASLMELGLAKDGSIQAPPLGANSPAGWYRDSPTPGQIGPSVILGHIDSTSAGRAIFYELGALRPGDIATVTLADQTVAVFQVDSVEKYAKSTFPTLRVYGNTDHSALRLITCGGSFNTHTRSYEDNIVVYAHLVSSHRA